MQRKNMYFSSTQVKELHAISKESGISFSELVRRAVDEYLQRQKEIHDGKR